MDETVKEILRKKAEPSRVHLTLFLLLLPGCGDRPVPHSEVVVRDSAGVRIVESPSVEELPRTRLSDAARLRLGWGENDPIFESITGGVLLPGGGAAVIDDAGSRLHLLDPEGGVREIGRRGEGPGEFMSPREVGRLQDGRLFVWDTGLSRLSLFSSAGEFLESHLVESRGAVNHAPRGFLPSGRIGWLPLSVSFGRGEARTGWIDAPLFVSSADGTGPDTVASVPMLHIEAEEGRPKQDPFARFGTGAVTGGGFVWGTNDRAELRWIREGGELTRIARWRQTPVPVDDAIWERYRTAYLRRAGEDPGVPPDERREEQLRQQRSIASPELPLFRSVSASRTGELWLGEYTPGAEPPRRFLVLSEEGPAQRWVEFEHPTRILDITRDRVLGVEVDGWGVQGVVIHDLPSPLSEPELH